MRKKYLCILICLFANALAFASAANRTITGVVISGEDVRQDHSVSAAEPLV